MAFGLVCCFVVAVWAGLEWWQLSNAYSSDNSSAFRAAVNAPFEPAPSAPTWAVAGFGGSMPGAAGGLGGNKAGLPTLDLMLQGAASVGGVPKGKTPSISAGFEDINKAISGK